MGGFDRGAFWSMVPCRKGGTPRCAFIDTFVPDFINDWVTNPKTNEYGVVVGKTNVICPAYADDLALLVLYQQMFNKLLQLNMITVSTFIIEKSVVVLLGKDTVPRMPVTVGNGKLTVVSERKYMGVVLSLEKKEKKNRKSIQTV